jgi:Protein of unknown function (DUF2815)
MLKDVRLSFPVLFEAKAFEEGGKKEFSASFLIPKSAPIVKEVQQVMLKIATEKWGEKGSKQLETLFRDDRLCLHDGDRKDYEGYDGHFYLRSSNSVRPLTIDRARNPITEADGKLYSGCYVNANITLWPQDNKWGKRINSNLRGVQFFRDGEAFSGGQAGNVDEFEAHEDSTGAPDLNSMFT